MFSLPRMFSAGLSPMSKSSSSAVGRAVRGYWRVGVGIFRNSYQKRAYVAAKRLRGAGASVIARTLSSVG